MSFSEKQKQLEQNSPIETSCSYQGKLITIRTDKIQETNQYMRQYDIVLHPGAVAVIPLDARGRLYFVQQWRRAAQDILTELPAGTLEKGEDPLVCAQRELQEEIGYRAKKMTSLGGFFSTPGFSNEYLHMFLAEDLVHSPLIGDDHQQLDLCLLSLQESLRWIDLGKIKDAKTICGIYRYLRWKST